MRRPGGILLETNLDTGKVREFDTYCCRHCGKHIILWKHQKSAGHFCSHCSGTICPQCAALGDCDPLRKKLEGWARQQYDFDRVKDI